MGQQGTIPWEDIFEIGAGYDSRTCQFRPSPFVDDSLEIERLQKITPRAIYDSHIVHAEHRLEEDIKLSCLISTLLPLGPFSASTDLSHMIKCNSTTVTMIVSCTINSLPQKSRGTPTLKPVAEWQRRWRAKKFAKIYGSHFISGHQCQASLVVVLCHSTATKENMDAFKAKVGIDYKIASLTAVSEYAKIVKSCEITTSMHCSVSGVDPRKVLQHINLNDTDPTPLFKTFLEGYAPVPYLAYVTPYSGIDSRAIGSNQILSLPQDLVQATSKSRLLWIRAQSCGMKTAHSMLPTLSDLCEQVCGMDLSDPRWRDQLALWKLDFERGKKEIDECYRLQGILERAAQLVPKTEWRRNTWYKTGQDSDWECGLTQHPQLARCEAKLERTPKRMPHKKPKKLLPYSERDKQSARDSPSTSASTKMPKPVVRHDVLHFPQDSRNNNTIKHNYHDRIILGAKIQSHRKDIRRKWKLREGGIGEGHHGVLLIEFGHDRGFFQAKRGAEIQLETAEKLFDVEVWSVDRELFARI